MLAGNTPGTSALKHEEVTELPIDRIKLSEDVPQFKEEADESGIVESLQGKYSRTPLRPIVVWERQNGDLEVITGRHRLDLARRSGENTIPAQVLKESEGFTKQQAIILDAEANIQDGQGSVYDHAQYIRQAGLTREEAQARGLVRGDKAEQGFTIGKYAGDDLYTIYVNERGGGTWTDKKVATIARIGQDNNGLQHLGINYVLKNPRASAEQVGAVMQAFQNMSASGTQTDMFGESVFDGYLAEAEKRSKKALGIQRDISERLKILKAAKINPEKARNLGIDINVKDPNAIKSMREQMEQELYRWKDWPQYPDLVQQVVGKEDVESAGEQGAETPTDDQTTTFFSTTNYNLIDARRFLLQRNQGDPRKAWSSLESMVLIAASNGDPVNRGAIEAMRRALRLPRHYSQNLFGNLDRAERQYQSASTQEEQGTLFSTLSPEMEAERDLLLKRAGGDATRAWKIYERMLSAAATRGEPVDPRLADTMRRALLGTGEQADMFGEAAPEKVRKPFTKPVERPVQQSLEGLDEGTRYSTAPTDTPEFKRWFGDSKVVDENGMPLEVYHATDDTFYTFDQNKTQDSLFWFTSNRGKIEAGETGAAGRSKIVPVYLSAKKLAGWEEYDKYTIDELIQQGYDGIKLDDDYVVFSSNQIKSSDQVTFDDQGNAIPQEQRFDPNTPDIRYSTAESHPSPIGLPELDRMVVDMLGSHPEIRRKMGNKRGLFQPTATVGNITLKADIFIGPDVHHAYSPKKPTEEQIAQHKERMAKEHGVSVDDLVIRTARQGNGYVTSTYIRDHSYAGRALAHEIGHADDWLPEKDMERGNLLGRIAKLSHYLKTTLAPSGNPEDALTSRDRAIIRKRAKDLTSEDFNYKEDPEGFNARLSYLYHQFVQEEIEQRGLYHVKDTGQEGSPEWGGGMVTPGIRTELVNLSRWWRGPFDPQGQTSCDRYRNSGKELYADAISVLLNAPDVLADRAPQFDDALRNFFDKHQPMADLYKQIQEELSQGLTPEKRLERDRAMMRRSSDAKNQAIEKRLQEGRIPKTPKEFIRSVLYDFADTTAYLPTQEAKLAVKNINYAASQLEQYQRDMKEQVGDVMKQAGASWDDFGVYLMRRRAANERKDLANPGLIRGKDAEALLEALHKDIGDKQYAAIEQAAKAMWDIRNRHIIPILRESGLFSEELMHKIETNEEYATFSVVKYFEQHHGGDFSATIKRQIGTAEDIANPFFATVRKDGALLFAATSNIAKRTMVDQMNKYDRKNIQEAKYKWNGVTWAPQEPDNPKVYGLVRYVEDGVQKGVVVRREIADLFKHDPQNAGVVFDGLSAATGLLKSMFTANNPLFAIWNIQRDARSTLHNIPTTGLMGELTLAPDLAWSYQRTIRDAYLHAFKKHSTPLMRELLEGGLVIADRQWTARDRTNVDEYERMQAEFGLKPDKLENVFRKGARAIFHDFNQMVEVWSKLAGFEYMKRKGLVDQHDMRNIMRGIIGSPDFLTRGRYTMWTNMLFLYSNAQVQGLDAAYRAVKANPVRYMMRRMAYTIIPSLIMAYLAFGDDDDDEIKDYREAFRAIPDYEKARMITFPVAWDGSKVSWIPMPQDHIGELLHGMIWNTFASDDKSLKKIFNVAVGAVPMEPGSLNPWLNLGRAAFEYAIGQNPYDLFRGRPAIDETIWRAGGFRSAEEFAKWAWNQTGGSTFGNFERPFQVRESGAAGLPIIKPVMRRFLRTAEKQDAAEPVDTERARTVVSAKDFATEHIRKAASERDANPMRAFREWKQAYDVPRSYKYSDFKRVYSNLKEKRWGETRH